MSTTGLDDHHPAVMNDGYGLGQVRWPRLSAVEAAEHDATQLLTWSRGLPIAATPDQREIIARIVRYLPPAVRRDKIAAR